MIDQQYQRFVGISPRAWEHPADRAALAALRQIPGMQEVIRFLVGITGEKALRLLFLGSAVRVSPMQFPRLQAVNERATAILDAPEVPELYVAQNPVMNAMAVGVSKPFIVLNSALVQNLDDQELVAVVGHELAHILSGHVLYKTMLRLLLDISQNALLSIPGGPLVVLGLIAALLEWDRKSELSADRAGLLCGQDADVSYRALMKLAGGPDIAQMDIDEFFKQAEEYEAGGTVLDGVYKLLNLLGKSHPFPVLRVTELRRWIDAGAYGRVMGGDYARRDSTEAENVAKDFEDAARAYREDVRDSKDPLAQAVADLGKTADKVRQDAESFFSNLFKSGGQ